jgi:hypothetical protein
MALQRHDECQKGSRICIPAEMNTKLTLHATWRDLFFTLSRLSLRERLFWQRAMMYDNICTGRQFCRRTEPYQRNQEKIHAIRTTVSLWHHYRWRPYPRRMDYTGTRGRRSGLLYPLAARSLYQRFFSSALPHGSRRRDKKPENWHTGL